MAHRAIRTPGLAGSPLWEMLFYLWQPVGSGEIPDRQGSGMIRRLRGTHVMRTLPFGGSAGRW